MLFNHEMSFHAGSEIFRRNMKMMLVNKDITSWLITQTLKPDFFAGKTCEEQLAQSLPTLKKCLSVFEWVHICVEFTEAAVVHYHITAHSSNTYLNKYNGLHENYNRSSNKDEQKTFLEYMIMLYSQGDPNNKIFSFNTQHKHLDFQSCYAPYELDDQEQETEVINNKLFSKAMDNLVSYCHKDTDRTFRFLGLAAKFTFCSKFQPIEYTNLQKLVNFKHKKF